MNALEKRANIANLTKALAPQASRIFRAKQLPNSRLANQIREGGPAYYPLKKQLLRPNAPPEDISKVYEMTAVRPKPATVRASVLKGKSTGGLLPSRRSANRASVLKGKSIKGLLSSRRPTNFFKKNPNQTVEGANKRFAEYTDKIYSPKGAGAGAVSRSARRVKKTIRQAAEKGVRLPKSFKEQSSKLVRIRDTLKGKGPAQRMFNMAVNRHELAERAVSRKFGENAPSFFSHVTPRPMLNDMNVAASMTGQGSEAARRAFRIMREPELKALGKVIYPRAGRMKYDPRRLLPGTKQQEEAFARLQNLGLPGQRINRHGIKKILQQYQDAANRNTYAFRRASDPRLADTSALQFFLRDNPNFIRNTAVIGTGSAAGLNKLFRG